jgi:hypothetical protein
MFTSFKKSFARGRQLVNDRWNDPVWSKVISHVIIWTTGLALLVVGYALGWGRQPNTKIPEEVEIVKPPSPREQREPHEQKTPQSSVPPSAPTATAVTPAAGTAVLVHRGALNAGSVAVLFRDAEGATVSSFTDKVTANVRGGTRPFTEAFITTGRFDRALSGDASALTDLGIDGTSASLIVLGTRTLKTTTEQPLTNETTFRADASAMFRVFRPQAGFASQGAEVKVVGPGFTRQAAEEMADERLVFAILRELSASPGLERP